jgi:aminopeptidase N
MRTTLLLFFALFLFGCKSTKDAIVNAPVVEERMLDTLSVTAPKKGSDGEHTLPVFNASATRTMDLIHTSLDLSFDWTKQHVMGKAELTLKPYFYDTDIVELDAVGFIIHDISWNGQKLKYDYDQKDLTIQLGRTISRDNLIKLKIDYTARPEENPQGGSAAITSDKGLFFIDPLGTDPSKPTQIWTQGETENNSRWFPTIDKPNERCSQEIKITIEDKYATLSNGRLVSSKKNGNGTRTDHWSQEKPHAPYLFMLGIGEFAVVKDSWKGMDLMYYVEPEYEADAKMIFNHTAEMLTFFSDMLDYPYPWDKYAQLIAKDFVSGAMENTGAVIFGDFCQRTTKQLVDSDNDYIVAHEMFHHWFGDLVTCENWANLTMNEGFANYSEYLWFEHKYGSNRADSHRDNELGGYLGSLQRGGAHPLIHYGYDDKEQMFDAHSYNKGGLVLHMLRGLVGDDAFFASLNKYLTDNEYSDVEADELRLAFEDITGKDLIWFFDQWYFSAGHPQLEVDFKHDGSALSIDVKQNQDADKYPAIFQLPTTVAIYDKSGKASFHDITINQRKQSFSIPYSGDYAWASIDAYDNMLAEITTNLSAEQYGYQLKQSPNFRDKFAALNNLGEDAAANDLYASVLPNGYHRIIARAMSKLPADEKYRSLAETVVKNHKHSNARTSAINYLAGLTPNAANSAGIISQMKGIIKNDPSYRPANAALSYINKLDPAEGIKLTETLKDNKEGAFKATIADIYMSSGDKKYVPILLDDLEETRAVEFYFASQKLLPFLKEQDTDAKLRAAQIYLDQSNHDGPPFVKFVAKAAAEELNTSLGDEVSDEIKNKFAEIIGGFVMPE